MAITESYSFRSGLTRPPTGYTATTNLHDGVAGDTGTGEGVTDSVAFGAGDAYHVATSTFSAAQTFSCPVALSSAAFTWYTNYNAGSPPFSPPPDPADPDLGSSTTMGGFYSLDGVTWTPFSFDSGAAVVGPGTFHTETATRAFTTPVNVRFVQFWVTSRLKVWDQNTTITATAGATDVRSVYVELPPQAAPVLSAQGACEGAQNSLSWTAVPCSTSYDIERGGVVIQTGLIPASLSAPAFVDAPVTVGTAYTYRVRARNDAGAGPWSAAQIVTPCVVLTAPTGTTTAVVENVCRGQQVTYWLGAPVAGATGYRVFLDGSIPIYEGPYIPSLALAQVYSPLTYEAHTLTVQAFNAVGSGPMGTPLTFTPCDPECECTVWTEERCR
jgi:hypothetical protein